MNYITKKVRKTFQLFTYLFNDSAFFLQSQMDINPQSRWYNEQFVHKTGGYYPNGSNKKRKIHNLEPWDNTRRDLIVLLLRTILDNNIEGDFAEVGVYRGQTARLIHHYAPERMLHLFDTFEGFPENSVKVELKKVNNKLSRTYFNKTSLDLVKNNIASANNNVFLYKGYFPESVPEGFSDKTFAFVHLDADLYDPTFEGLGFFYSRMSPGGMFLIHDYNAWVGVRKAVDDFFVDKKEIPVPMPDKSGSVLIVKQ